MKNTYTILLGAIIAGTFSGCATTPPTFKDKIAEKIEDHKSNFRDCYGNRPSPRKNGTVRVTFVYASTGKVTSATVKESTLKDPVVEDCVLSVLRTIQFDPSPETVQVNYPFAFSEGGH